MKKRGFIISAISIVSLLAASPLLAGSSASSAALTAEEQAELVAMLEQSRDKLIELVGNVSDEAWTYQPAADRWSIGHVVEHLLKAEKEIFGSVQKAAANDPNPKWAEETAGKTEMLRQVLLDRSQRAQSPPSIVPEMEMSREEVMEQFKEARAKTLAFAREPGIDLKEHTEPHEFEFFGVLNAHQWLVYIPLHNQRHLEQIAEIKADDGFSG